MRYPSIATLTLMAGLAALPVHAQQAAVTASPPTSDTGSAAYQGTGQGAGSASGISRQSTQSRVTTGIPGGRLSDAQRLGRGSANGNGAGIGHAPQGNRPVVAGNSSTHADTLGQDLSNPTAAGRAGANGNGAGVQR